MAFTRYWELAGRARYQACNGNVRCDVLTSAADGGGQNLATPPASRAASPTSALIRSRPANAQRSLESNQISQISCFSHVNLDNDADNPRSDIAHRFVGDHRCDPQENRGVRLPRPPRCTGRCRGPAAPRTGPAPLSPQLEKGREPAATLTKQKGFQFELRPDCRSARMRQQPPSPPAPTAALPHPNPEASLPTTLTLAAAVDDDQKHSARAGIAGSTRPLFPSNDTLVGRRVGFRSMEFRQSPTRLSLASRTGSQPPAP